MLIVGAAAAIAAAVGRLWSAAVAFVLIVVVAGAAGRGHGRVRRGPGRGRWRRQRAAPRRGPAVTADEPDPLIHVPTRLRIVVTLAALPDGDALSFTRLQ